MTILNGTFNNTIPYQSGVIDDPNQLHVSAVFEYATKEYIEGASYAENKLLLLDKIGDVLYLVKTVPRPFVATTVVDDINSGFIVSLGGGGGSMTASQIKTALDTLTGANRLGTNSINEDTNRLFLTDAQSSAITTNSAKNSYPSGDATKVGHISVTQAVDLDTLETASHTHANKAILDATTASFVTAQETKLSNVSITQPVNLDTLETDSHTHANKAVLDATTASFVTAQETKLGHISVTQAVDLDTVESDVANRVPLSTPVALTDGASVAANCASTDNRQFTLAAANTTCTIALSNLSDGHTCEFLITPQSTATFSFTFTHAGLTMKVAGEGSAVWPLDATSGSDYRVFVSRKGTKGLVSYDSRAY